MSRSSRNSSSSSSAAAPKAAASSQIRLITAPAASTLDSAVAKKRKRGAETTAAPVVAAAPVAAASKRSNSSKKTNKAVAEASSADMMDVPEAAPSAAAASKKASSSKKPKSSPKKKKKIAAASSTDNNDGFKFGTLSRDFEIALTAEGKGSSFIGVDEAGRGPLAGPVVCAAVWAPIEFVDIKGVHDSKKMSEPEREKVYAELTSHPAVIWATAIIEHDEIDRINILEATMRGMERAVLGVVEKMNARRKEATEKKGKQDTNVPIPPASSLLLVDGNRIPPAFGLDAAPPSNLPAMFVIKGDSLVYSIAAASVIAKVTRDRLMLSHHASYPLYNFAQHKGYGVSAHMQAIWKHGPCPIHRMTFAPMKHMKKKTSTDATTTNDDAAAEEEEEEANDESAPTSKRRKAATVAASKVSASSSKKAASTKASNSKKKVSVKTVSTKKTRAA